MVQNTKPDQRSESAQLNYIAEHWTEHGEYPDGISETDVQELSRTVYNLFEDFIEIFVDEVTLTQREAEVCALTMTMDKYHHSLTEDAAALVLSTQDTEFSDPAESDETIQMSRPLTSEEVQHYRSIAEQKIKEAKQTPKKVTTQNREDFLTNPEKVWLDQHTLRRLRNQLQADENTLDDVVTRYLDEMETWQSLEDFIRGYLNARGQDNVAQVAVERESFKTKTLHITAHTAVQEKLPSIVTETDAITHRGHRYDLSFNEDPYEPQDFRRITLYASDTIHGMDEVPLEDGLTAADEYMRELIERDELVERDEPIVSLSID